MRLDCIGGMYCLDMDVVGVSWAGMDARSDAEGIALETFGAFTKDALTGVCGGIGGTVAAAFLRKESIC